MLSHDMQDTDSALTIVWLLGMAVKGAGRMLLSFDGSEGSAIIPGRTCLTVHTQPFPVSPSPTYYHGQELGVSVSMGGGV